GIVVTQGFGEVDGGVECQTARVAFLDAEVSAMPRIVIEIREQVDGAELGVDQVVLLRQEDFVLEGAVVTQGNGERNLVDVPVAHQPYTCGSLVRRADQPGGPGFELEPL